MSSSLSTLLRTASMLLLVFVGLLVLTLIFLWPVLLSVPPAWKTCLLVTHVPLLVFMDPYLFIHRKALYPIRYLLMPILIAITKSEAIKEGADTWYLSATRDLPVTDSVTTLLQSFPKRVRRDNKRKLKRYHDRGIRTTTTHSDYFSLWRDIPVIIEHERHALVGSENSLVEECVKRFLVMFMVIDGYIDRYYAPNDDDRPVALSLFVQNGRVLQDFMYFCVGREKESGIWHYSRIRSMLRVSSQKIRSEREQQTNVPLTKPRRRNTTTHSNEIDYVNFMCHHDYAKKCVGAKAASWKDESLMRDLYPFQAFCRPPANIIQTRLDTAEMFK